MTRLYDLTFEVDDPTSFGDILFGDVVEVTAVNPLKGLNSVLFTITAPDPGALEIPITAVTTVYLSAYLRVLSAPLSLGNIVRFRKISSGDVAYVKCDSTHIGLYSGSNVQIGSLYTYAINTTYRIGLRYTAGTGSNATLQLFIAAGDNPFSDTAIAETATNASTFAVDDIVIGMRNGIVTSQYKIDNIRIDTIAMPTDDVVIPPDALSIAQNNATITMQQIVDENIAYNFSISTDTISYTGVNE